MRNTIFIFLLISLGGYAQDFPLDPKGGIVYQEVVEVDSMKKEQLYQNALKWIQFLSQEDENLITRRDSIAGSIFIQSSFIVYTQSGIFRKVSGKIHYSISLDVKNDKYRFNFSDFVFHYYSETRNYMMMDNHKTKQLEEPVATGWQKLWNKHRETVNTKIRHNIRTLKQKMTEKEPVVSRKPAEKTVEW